MHFNTNCKKLLTGILLIALYLLPAGCRKLTDPGIPDSRITSAQVYNNDTMPRQLLNGAYYEIMKSLGPLNGYTTSLCGVYSDELILPATLEVFEPFFASKLQANNKTIEGIWIAAYKAVYTANDIAEGLKKSIINVRLQQQFLGEAYFLRALNYFYLVNLFGDVPMITGTNYTKNAMLARTPQSDIYDQMIIDLQTAQNILTESYDTTGLLPYQRVRPNRLAATALLARVYLYNKNWAAAEAAATQVIQSPLYILEQDLKNCFLNTSREAILQFQPLTGANASEGRLFLPAGAKINFALSDSLLKAFEPADIRRQWIAPININGSVYYYPFKYKLGNASPYIEYNTIMRLAEQYLVRAEARIMQNKLAEATADLNLLRARAGLGSTNTYASQLDALKALEQERRVELFAEWGHRWLDVKRLPPFTASPTGIVSSRAEEVMSSYKPEWQLTALLWPIPERELKLNSKLTQNNGY